MPDDDVEYQPAGELSDVEQAWHDRLKTHQGLGWRVVGRDERGCLTAKTVLDCGKDKTRFRHVTMTLTPAGVIYSAVMQRPATTKGPA